jgi:ABC-type maltose transport system permease subunit
VGVGLLVGTVAAVPVLFFLLVINSLVLALAAVCVELGLFTASRVALSRPRKPVGAERFIPPGERR